MTPLHDQIVLVVFHHLHIVRYLDLNVGSVMSGTEYIHVHVPSEADCFIVYSFIVYIFPIVVNNNVTICLQKYCLHVCIFAQKLFTTVIFVIKPATVVAAHFSLRSGLFILFPFAFSHWCLMCCHSLALKPWLLRASHLHFVASFPFTPLHFSFAFIAKPHFTPVCIAFFLNLIWMRMALLLQEGVE